MKTSSALGEVAWYTYDWADPAAFDADQLAACGVTSVIATNPGWQFGPQNQVLSLDLLRGLASDLKAHMGGLAVWWSFSTVSQIPPRTLCSPKDAAKRHMILDNYASIGRVAREMGFVGLALNAENFSGQGLSWPDEPGARDLGADLAKACRRDNPGLKLAAYGPLGTPPDGWRKVWRGFFGAAGKGSIFWTEDSNDMAHANVKWQLAHVQNVTQCAIPGLGWFPAGHAADPAAYIASAATAVQNARKAGVPLMLYREGRMSDAARTALGKVLKP